MPLQNRVTPLGDLVAHPARGLVYGNRRCAQRTWCHRPGARRHGRWISCRLEFKGWQRGPKMRPGKFTELFFLDEATAFAAGHRPCALCRREDYSAVPGTRRRDACRPDRRPARRRAARPVPAVRRARSPRRCVRAARRRAVARARRSPAHVDARRLHGDPGGADARSRHHAAVTGGRAAERLERGRPTSPPNRVRILRGRACASARRAPRSRRHDPRRHGCA